MVSFAVYEAHTSVFAFFTEIKIAFTKKMVLKNHQQKLFWDSVKKLKFHLFCYVHIPGETRQQYDDYEHAESWANDNVYDDGPFDNGNDQSDAEDTTNSLISQPRQV